MILVLAFQISGSSLVRMAPQYKIYLCGSIRGGRQDVEIYGKIAEKLKKYGTVLTPFVADPNVRDEGKVDRHKHMFVKLIIIY